MTEQSRIDGIVAAVVRDHDALLLPWFDGPPQTNEAGRSAALMAALLWLSSRIGPRFELNEIGASAGANTMIERYAYDLGGVHVGPPDSPVLIAPEWHGAPPPAAAVQITAIAGCDRAPIDLADPAAALRLKAAHPPALTRADAADWAEERLDQPQPVGVTRVLYHSIVWQYLPPETRARITAAMENAGARSTPEQPLAWIMLETNRETFRHELRVRHWPAAPEWTLMGEAHAHGAWVRWLAGASAQG